MTENALNITLSANPAESRFPVSEIFTSINGEGTLSGELAVFIRLCNCNLRCSYCDTSYAWKSDSAVIMTAAEIIDRVKSVGKNIRNITLTGGEPFFRRNAADLLKLLSDEGYLINIETNGSIDLKPYLDLPFSGSLIFCCDYKLPASGEEKRMHLPNIDLLRPQDVLKLVIGSTEDFTRSLEIIRERHSESYIYLSAVFGRVEPMEIVEKLLAWSKEISTEKIRVQLQLHKYIWNSEMRGV